MIAVRRGDFFSGLALAALGTFVVVQALGWEYLTPDGPGAGFFPRWYGVAMIALSLVLVVRSFRATPVEHRSDATRTRAFVCWAAFVACVLMSKAIGFVASFALLCWFVATMLFAQRQRVAIAFALGAGASFWLVFVAALEVALPRGPWGF